jgi:hypothetical protein
MKVSTTLPLLPLLGPNILLSTLFLNTLNLFLYVFRMDNLKYVYNEIQSLNQVQWLMNSFIS